MLCPFCGFETGDLDFCIRCNRHIKPYRQIASLANYYYNEGLDRAMIRDISGAAENLKQCLKYNKYHLDARNLLGLLYFETQQYVLALSEWAVSTSFYPENNIANEYLKEFEYNPTLLSNSDTAVRKYNLALDYCKDESWDLAVIQLKKVKDILPKFIPGLQLLALMYIKEEKYDQAKKLLKQATLIDTNNTLTLKYLKEVREKIKTIERQKKKKDNTLSFQDGNDTVIIPTFTQKIMGIGGTLANIFIGFAVGFLAVYFLAMPNARMNARKEADEEIGRMSSAISTKENSVTALKNEIDSLTNELEDYQAKSDVAESNDSLIKAYMAYQEEDSEKASRLLSRINKEFLGEDGSKLYDQLSLSVNSVYLQELYDEASSDFTAGEYTSAIEKFEEIVGVDVYFGEGVPLYYLGQSYRHVDNMDSAKKYYAMYIKAFPGTNKAETAKKYVSDADIANAPIEVWHNPDIVEAETAGEQQQTETLTPTDQEAAANQAQIEQAIQEAMENQ